MNKIVSFFIAGAILVAAIRLFKFEQELSDRVIANIKTKEPDQIVVALAITTGLGMVAVLASQAFRKVS